MADIDLKSATPDTSIDLNAFLFGADSQSAATPSVYQVSTLKTLLMGSGSLNILSGKTLTANNTLTLAGTDGGSLNIGVGGTLAALAFKSSAAIASDVSGLGTGIAAALAVNAGNAGAPVLFNGAGGTPSSLTLTNATGLPAATGIANGALPSGVTINNGNWSGAVLSVANGGSGTSTPGLVAGSNITITGSWPNQTIAASGGGGSTTSAIGYTIDGGGNVIATGLAGAGLVVPFACTITEWTLIADVSGSIVIDVWKDTYANYPPTVADTIAASAKPTISSATKNKSSTLTGWTTSVAAGDILLFNVDSCSSIKKAVLLLTVTK